MGPKKVRTPKKDAKESQRDGEGQNTKKVAETKHTLSEHLLGSRCASRSSSVSSTSSISSTSSNTSSVDIRIGSTMAPKLGETGTAVDVHELDEVSKHVSL